MKIAILSLLICIINCSMVLSRSLEYSDVYKFCAGLCNAVDESKDTSKLLICQRKCHDKMIEEGFANGNTKKLPRRHFKKRRGIIRRAGRMIFKPVRYIYRKFVPKKDENYNYENSNVNN